MWKRNSMRKHFGMYRLCCQMVWLGLLWTPQQLTAVHLMRFHAFFYVQGLPLSRCTWSSSSRSDFCSLDQCTLSRGTSAADEQPIRRTNQDGLRSLRCDEE